MPVVRIPVRRIKNWRTFHNIFAETLGFPDYYGHNMAAWVDCLTYVDVPDTGMTKVTVEPGDVLILLIEDREDAVDFAQRCPEQFAALVECAAFVNWRRMEQGGRAIIALAFYK